MATIQIQKTRNAETFTKTAIAQKQSLEVVQTMLHGSLSSLSYLRSFFPEKAFDKQVYEMGDNVHPYEEYAAGKLAKSHDSASSPSTVMQILRRGRSKRVDMFLDWLEKGAFTALKDGNLHAVQVYVHADRTDRQKVIETYTFTVRYLRDDNDGRKLAGLELDTAGHYFTSVGATNSALQQLLRNVITLCNTLPDLPVKRFVSMALFYVPESVQLYQPKGFMPGTTNGLLFAEAEDWERRTETLEDLSSGFHCTSFRVSYLQHTAANLRDARFSFQPFTVPLTLQYNNSYAIVEDMSTAQLTRTPAQITDVKPPSNRPVATATPSTIVESEVSPQRPSTAEERFETLRPFITPAPTSDAPAALPTHIEQTSDSSTRHSVVATKLPHQDGSQLNETVDTQSSNVPEMARALKDMMQPEYITQGDTQTQAQPYSRTTSDKESDDQTNETISPSKLSEISPQNKATRPVLSQVMGEKLERSKEELRLSARQLAKTKGSTKVSDVILCQCGHSEEEGDMVSCTICETWQHLQCYGYTGDDDPRLPVDHVCYQCLLGHDEEQTLKKMEQLARKRRGMHLAVEDGLKTQRDFVTAFGLHSAIAAPIYQHLKNEGYVVATKGSHRAGFSTSGKPHFVAVKSGINHEKMLRNLFDPMLNINHRYEVPEGLATQPLTLTQRLLKSQAEDMPPPATPASELRRNAAKTPGSGLDLRASITPFETPSRPRSGFLQPGKRARSEELEVITPQKRRRTPASSIQRMRSVQTEFLLDAGGLSSSPAGSVRG